MKVMKIKTHSGITLSLLWICVIIHLTDGQGFTVRPKDVTVLQNDNATIPCRVQNTTGVVVKWEEYITHNATVPKLIYSSETGVDRWWWGTYGVPKEHLYDLVVIYALRTHGGRHVCTVTTGTFTAQAEAQVVVISDYRTPEMMTTRMREGETHPVTCRGEYYADPNITAEDHKPHLEVRMGGTLYSQAEGNAIEKHPRSSYYYANMFEITLHLNYTARFIDNGTEASCIIKTKYPAFNVTETSVLFIERAVICPEISVTGSTYQSGRHGTYTLQSKDWWCRGRPTYRKGGQYIFATPDDTWVIGSTHCTDVGGIHNVDGSAHLNPDQQLTVWQEYTNEQKWRDNTRITVSCSECTVLKLEGTENHDSREGLYTKQWEENCNDRTSYLQEDSSNPNYMYYVESHYDASGSLAWDRSWLIGSSLCAPSAGVTAVDEALSPDKVTAAWEEYTSDGWKETDISVTCMECQKIEITGGTHQENAEGLYSVVPYARSAGRPVYKGVNNQHYIYYLDTILDTNGNTTRIAAWLVGDVPYVTKASIHVYSRSQTPDMAQGVWSEYSGDDQDWVQTSLQVKCKDADINGKGTTTLTTHADINGKGTTTLTTPKTTAEPPVVPPHSNTNPTCPEIAISGTRYNSGAHGIYTLLPRDEWCRDPDRPTYKANNFYLSVSPYNTWVVSSEPCSDKGFIHNNQQSTTLDVDEMSFHWEEYIPSEKQWVTIPTISIACAQCTVLEVSHTTNHQEMEGTYDKQWHTNCNDRATYIRRDLPPAQYLYYLADGKDTITHRWLAGPTLCGETVGLGVYDEAQSPDGVVAAWHEWTGYDWVDSHVTVQCAECEEITVTGSTHQNDVEGTYDVMVGVRSGGRPVYIKHGSPEYYIYYINQTQTDTFQPARLEAWLISSTFLDTAARIHAYDPANTPDRVNKLWTEFEPQSERTHNTDVKITCRGAGSKFEDVEDDDKKAKLLIGLSIPLAFLVGCMLVLCVVYFYRRRSKQDSQRRRNEQAVTYQTNGGAGAVATAAIADNVAASHVTKSGLPPEYLPPYTTAPPRYEASSPAPASGTGTGTTTSAGDALPTASPGTGAQTQDRTNNNNKHTEGIVARDSEPPTSFVNPLANTEDEEEQDITDIRNPYSQV